MSLYTYDARADKKLIREMDSTEFKKKMIKLYNLYPENYKTFSVFEKELRNFIKNKQKFPLFVVKMELSFEECLRNLIYLYPSAFNSKNIIKFIKKEYVNKNFNELLEFLSL